MTYILKLKSSVILDLSIDFDLMDMYSHGFSNFLKLTYTRKPYEY